MYEITIERPEGQYVIDCMPRPQGKLVSVRFREFPDDEVIFYQALHILQTEFETLHSVIGELPDLFPEDFDVEKLAIDNEIEIRFYDDADCVTCGIWVHYADMIQLDNFEYQCIDCNANTVKEGN
jgi:hypothetical protein